MNSVAADSQEEFGTILITGLAAGGDGVGRTEDGRVVFVVGAAPGESVELEEIRIQKRMVRAKRGRITKPSPNRVEPRCAHFGTCGGCRWQHVAYAAQLDSKKTIVRDALERIGRLSSVGEIEIIPSPDPFGYRARARWVESEAGLGYRVRGSKEVSPVTECPVLVPAAEHALKERASSLPQSSDAQPGEKRKRGTEWVVTAGTEPEALVRLAKTGRGGGASKKEPRAVSIEACGEKLRVSATSFVQGNALLWDVFATLVRDECLFEVEDASALKLVELYSGIGFFTLPLARRGVSGIALESDRSALADLEFNLRKAGLNDRFQVLAGRVETRGDLAQRFSGTDTLLVDPPRIGLDGRVREAIATNGPKRVVYVLLRCGDAGERPSRAHGGGLHGGEHSCARSFFRRTPHVETVVRLER